MYKLSKAFLWDWFQDGPLNEKILVAYVSWFLIGSSLTSFSPTPHSHLPQDPHPPISPTPTHSFVWTCRYSPLVSSIQKISPKWLFSLPTRFLFSPILISLTLTITLVGKQSWNEKNLETEQKMHSLWELPFGLKIKIVEFDLPRVLNQPYFR